MDRIQWAALVIGGICTPILILYAMFPVWDIGASETHALRIERTISIGNSTVRTAIADTEAEREKGLSGVSGLKEDEGMLFIFENDGRHSFWMKGMAFPIDILWISSDKRVVHIEGNVSPDTFPQTFTANSPARYVLEVQAGFATEHGIEVGSKVTF